MRALQVSVFGGSSPKPGQPAYEEARQLGRQLAEAGHTVLTGGYIGTMEAVSRGASEAGGHVIGVTCDEIESWRPVEANAWVAEQMRFPTIRQRLFALIDNCDAAIALPGGAGTLAEIAVMWNHLLTSSITPRPLILVGPGWKTTFDSFFTALVSFVPEQDRKWLKFCSNVGEAADFLAEFSNAR
jgi:uncharacterized protein (TIGR00730 family)